jgi:hypothetical protein
MEKEILYLHVSPKIKGWLKRLCSQQIGRVSQSTMAERIFVAAQESGAFEKSRKIEGKKYGKSKV